MESKVRKRFDPDFKRHILELYEAGQSQAELAKAYQLHSTTIKNRVKRYHNSGSFQAKDNLTEEQKQIRTLERQL